jgi:polar amino acid transport system substrate-binding protein
MVTSHVVTKWIAHQASLIGLFLALTMPMTAIAESQPITFLSTESPPYWSPSLKDHGIGGATLKLLSEAAGIQYVIDYVPSNRFHLSSAPYMLGDPDFMKSQYQRAIIPIGIFHSSFFFYKPKHGPIEIKSIRDLSGHTLGVLRGSLQDRAAFERQGVRILEGNSEESLLKMLRKGRIDLCILVAGTGVHTINKIFPHDKEAFTQTVIPSLTRPLAIIINTSTPEAKAITHRYRQVLARVLNSEKYRALLQQFYHDEVVDDRKEQLDKFIQYYAKTGIE